MRGSRLLRWCQAGLHVALGRWDAGDSPALCCLASPTFCLLSKHSVPTRLPPSQQPVLVLVLARTLPSSSLQHPRKEFVVNRQMIDAFSWLKIDVMSLRQHIVNRVPLCVHGVLCVLRMCLPRGCRAASPPPCAARPVPQPRHRPTPSASASLTSFLSADPVMETHTLLPCPQKAARHCPSPCQCCPSPGAPLHLPSESGAGV